MTPAEQEWRKERIKRAQSLFKPDVKSMEIRFMPEGNAWFRWTHTLFLRRRTSVRALYEYLHEWAAMAQNIAVQEPLATDNWIYGTRRVPRRMWLYGDWRMSRMTARHLRSTDEPPHVYVLFNHGANAPIVGRPLPHQPKMLVKPWTTRERLLGWVAVGLTLLSGVGSWFSILSWFNRG